MSTRRKQSVISEVAKTDELPSIIVKLVNSSAIWTHSHHFYPFSRVLRLRVFQIVCGISILVMGAVGAIEEKGDFTNLALGVPAGVVTVIAAGASIHVSRGFGGYRSSTWTEGSVLRAIGPTPQTALLLLLMWISSIALHTSIFIQSTLLLKMTSQEIYDTKFQLAVVELVLASLTLVSIVEIVRVDLKHDPDGISETVIHHRSSSSDRTQTVQIGTSSTEGLIAD